MSLPRVDLQKSILANLGGAPLYGDNSSATLAKIVAAAGGVPAYGDTDAALLKKWLAAIGGTPLYSDNAAATLKKILDASGGVSSYHDNEARTLEKIAGTGGVSPPLPTDPAENFFVRTGITDATQKAAVTTLVADLQMAGLWSKITLLYPNVGGTAKAHAQNLKANQYNIAWKSTPLTHNAQGVTGVGTGYGDTGCSRAALPLNLHLSANVKTIPAAVGVVIGTMNNSTSFTDFNINPGGMFFRCNSNASYIESNIPTGFTVGSRSATDDQVLPPNASVFSTRANTPIGAGYTPNLFVMAENVDGAPLYYARTTIAFITAGAELTVTEAMILRDIQTSFQTTLGR